jgi:hypothetical protein
MNTTSVPSQEEKVSVMLNVITTVESLQLLEAIYGFVSDSGFRIVGITNTLSGEQRDLIWDVNWDFQKKFSQIDIEIILLQRRGRPISEVFGEGDSALIKREIVSQ